MQIILQGHDLETGVHETITCLFPQERHGLGEEYNGGTGWVEVALQEQPDGYCARVRACRGGRTIEDECRLPLEESGPWGHKRVATRAVKTATYRALVGFLPQPPVWGAMSGVKPAKPVRQAFPQGVEPVAADAFLQERFFIAPARRKLTIDCALAAQACQHLLQPQSVALYIGIPFCPSKCAYCSFVSGSTASWGYLMEPYLQVLCQEVEAAGVALARSGALLDSIYIGGGTPSTLSAQQLERLLGAVQAHLPPVAELTLEAGRPETITAEKLAVMSRFGVGRISINPQSMVDEVLARVGRKHSAQQVVDCYHMARQQGDFQINMDLIAGLPGDSVQGLLGSVEQLIGLNPENITIHCLALKRGAALDFGSQGQLPARVLDTAYGLLQKAGYQPYYLYRQKYIAGNLENVGFAKAGTQCRYNICMMEELCPVIALGAGGITKICGEDGRKISRMANPKYPKEYIEQAPRILAEKRELALF